MTIEAILKDDIQKAIQKHFDIDVEEVILQPTKKEFEGFYTFVTFPLTKTTRKAPAEIGQIIGAALVEASSVVQSFNVVQGFLNISLKDQTWLDLFEKMKSDPDYGSSPANGASVMVEFSSPNTNKPLHLGHLRNNFLGDSLSRILKASGYNIVKT
uniref:arginine--tRNA ligase domain-containing protein n=1 Tax=Dyadobacter sp. TaxID=1914288 RepID=UPI003F6F189B